MRKSLQIYKRMCLSTYKVKVENMVCIRKFEWKEVNEENFQDREHASDTESNSSDNVLDKWMPQSYAEAMVYFKMRYKEAKKKQMMRKEVGRIEGHDGGGFESGRPGVVTDDAVIPNEFAGENSTTDLVRSRPVSRSSVVVSPMSVRSRLHCSDPLLLRSAHNVSS